MKQILALPDQDGRVSGVWSLDGDLLICVEPRDQGPAIVLVPAEQVMTVAVDLPLATLARRTAALPFAIEDLLAEPVEDAHLALGAEIAPRRHLAGAVRHSVMREWVERLEAGGLGRASLMPDALALPTPPVDQWTVAVVAERALVRTPDGAGFALPLALLTNAWRGAGMPPCVVAGGELPPEMASGIADSVGATLDLGPAIDLRQGAYAPRRARLPALWRRLLIVVSLGIAAHGAIAVVDVLALRHQAVLAREATRALVRSLAPDATIGDDVLTDATALLPEPGPHLASGFLPLLGQTASALQPVAATATWRGVAYTAADGALTLQVEAADMAGLQKVQAALAAAGLTPTSGPATTADGRAAGELIVHPAARS